MISQIVNSWDKSSVKNKQHTNYVPGYHIYKPVKSKPSFGNRVWAFIELVCGIYLWFYAINLLSNKLVKKNKHRPW